MTEQKTLMEETMDVVSWSPAPEDLLLPTNPIEESVEVEDVVEEIKIIPEESPIVEVAGTVTAGLGMMAEASSPPSLTKKFKCSETFMAASGIMMERDVYYVIPTTALGLPDPEQCSLGLTYANEKPMGRLFSGQNRKARRSAEKEALKKQKAKKSKK